MKRLVSLATVAAICLTILSAPLVAGGHKFALHKECRVGDQVLEAGRYKLEVKSDGQAEIFRGSRLVATVQVSTVPIGRSTPNTIEVSSDGELIEIRAKKEKFILSNQRAG